MAHHKRKSGRNVAKVGCPMCKAHKAFPGKRRARRERDALRRERSS